MLILLVVLSLISILFNIALIVLVRDLKRYRNEVDVTVELLVEEPCHISPLIIEEYSKLGTYFSTFDQSRRNKSSSYKRAYAVWSKEETRLLRKYWNQLDLKTLSTLHQRSTRSLTSQLSLR